MLLDEIALTQKVVRTDAYQMSVGELITMYRDSELIIDPEFQRLFRWELGQKSKLIESLLLGIPLPPIFVFEKEDSKWELIDGLQRISTILEFMGLLKDADGKPRPPSFLEGTKYLPSLQNIVWEKSKRVPEISFEEQVELDKTSQLAIRRARIGVEILKRPSDNNTKYDLFQRLNAAGTPANAQELRNCITIMVNPKYYTFLKSLADQASFRNVIGATEEQTERQKHMEYASRFLVHTYIAYDGKLDVEEYIDEGMKQLAAAGKLTPARRTFTDTFSILDELEGPNSLRRFESDHHSGRISLAAFECIAIGIGKNIDLIRVLEDPKKFLNRKIRAFWKRDEIDKFFTPGLRGTIRVIPPFLTGLSRRIHAASFSFWAGVIPPIPILGRSLLYVQSHCVA